MKLKNIITFVALVTTLSACADLFDPSLENVRTEEQMFEHPKYALGVLGYAYSIMPYETTSTTDIATDDAVTNNLSTDESQSEVAIRMMSLGTWASNDDPVSQWQARKATIQYINVFLENYEEVEWSDKPYIQKMYQDHLRGQALALRALNMYYLLRNHAGWTADGQLLGFPILTASENVNSDFNVPRDSFQKCIEQIYADLDEAIELLPLDHENLDDKAVDKIPAKYREIGVTLTGDYNRVFGSYQKGLMSGRIAEAIKAQVALLAASPAYVGGTDVTYTQAAELAAVVLNRIGGVAGMDPVGHKWYMDTKTIDALGSGDVPQEILWRGDKNNGTANYQLGITQEANNFPPTLYGNGRINPSQNFVDAFPMADGYPITESSQYSKSDPYAGRDPRLAEFVIYNGASYKGQQIVTGAYGTDNNALNRTSTSTRTGYYLRKLMREDCDPNPSNVNAKYHYPVYIRYTEIFLAYAEAANEAYGPTGTGNNSYSAYDVIKALHDRAGAGNDYLESIKNDKEKMRELIRNERRIELSFENKRFWDMRRWKLDITEPVKGVRIEQVGGALQYNTFEVESRNYSNYMYYGPIPESEVLKWSNLDQNKGW